MPLNLAFGWVWILAGFVTGLLLGLRFHHDDWLGGYGSFQRRMIRLGHISFIGLGVVNVLFALSASHITLGSGALALASWSLIAGGVTMPACCGLMAWRRVFYWGFGIPVACLVVGGTLTVAGILGR